jgi:hypothetical protein
LHLTWSFNSALGSNSRQPSLPVLDRFPKNGQPMPVFLEAATLQILLHFRITLANTEIGTLLRALPRQWLASLDNHLRYYRSLSALQQTRSPPAVNMRRHLFESIHLVCNSRMYPATRALADSIRLAVIESNCIFGLIGLSLLQTIIAHVPARLASEAWVMDELRAFLRKWGARTEAVLLVHKKDTKLSSVTQSSHIQQETTRGGINHPPIVTMPFSNGDSSQDVSSVLFTPSSCDARGQSDATPSTDSSSSTIGYSDNTTSSLDAASISLTQVVWPKRHVSGNTSSTPRRIHASPSSTDLTTYLADCAAAESAGRPTLPYSPGANAGGPAISASISDDFASTSEFLPSILGSMPASAGRFGGVHRRRAMSLVCPSGSPSMLSSAVKVQRPTSPELPTERSKESLSNPRGSHLLQAKIAGVSSTVEMPRTNALESTRTPAARNTSSTSSSTSLSRTSSISTAGSNTAATGQLTQLDANTLVKASVAMSQHVVLDELIAVLVEIALENMGAERCVFMLNRDGSLKIHAVADMRHGRCVVNLLQIPTPLDNYQQVPHALVRFVQRSQRPEIINNVDDEHNLTWNQGYARQARVKSMCALPIMQQRGGGLLSLIAIMYFEHKAYAGLFSAGKLEVLSLLSSQISVSLLNAQLFDELKARSDELKRANDELKEKDRVKDAFLMNTGHELLTPLHGTCACYELFPPNAHCKVSLFAFEQVSSALPSRFAPREHKPIVMPIGSSKTCLSFSISVAICDRWS